MKNSGISCFALASFVLASFRLAFANEPIVLPEKLFDLNGTAVSTDTFSGKLLGLYFSASWSDPCRKFSPKLVVFRNANENEFEVLLVSSDGNAKAQQNYMRKFKMPWPAAEIQSVDKRRLSQELGVSFLPSLVILDEKRRVISRTGKEDIIKYREKTIDYWESL